MTAASRHGSTAEVAQAIGDRLTGRGFEVDVIAPDTVETIDGYDAVVLGSAAYMGHWLEPARGLVERGRGKWAARAVWLFTCGPVGEPPRPGEDPVDVAAAFAETGAREHRIFGGRLRRSDLGFAEKAVVIALRAPQGDFRPWPEIREWADRIADALTRPA